MEGTPDLSNEIREIVKMMKEAMGEPESDTWVPGDDAE